MVNDFILLFTQISWVAALLIAGAILLGVISLGMMSKRMHFSIVLLVVASLMLGFGFAVITPFPQQWDEVYHAVVAANMTDSMLAPQFYSSELIEIHHETWVANHIWLHKPPLTLWQMALSMNVFGVNFLSVRIPSILMHSLLVFPIYRMGAFLFHKHVGFIAAALFTFLNYPLELLAGVHTADHVDVTFVFYITLSVWCWFEYFNSKKIVWLVFMGIASGGAVLTKWLVGLLVFSGAGLVLLITKELRNSGKEWLGLFLAIGSMLAVVVPWNWYALAHYPTEYLYELNFSARHFSEVIELHDGDGWFYWENLKTIYGAGSFIPMLLVGSFMAFLVKPGNRSKRVFLGTVIILPYLFFSLAATKMSSFLIIVSPLILIIVSGVVFQFCVWLFARLENKFIRRILFVSAMSLVVLSVLRPQRIVVNHNFVNKESQLARKQMIEKHQFIQNLSWDEEGLMFLSVDNGEMSDHAYWMFYHPSIQAYHSLSETDKSRLIKMGYEVKCVDMEARIISTVNAPD